jgi:hypothetical protein
LSRQLTVATNLVLGLQHHPLDFQLHGQQEDGVGDDAVV